MDGPVRAEIALPAGSPGAVRDAASALRASGGGFSRIAGTVGGAALSLTSWEGMASIEFGDLCISHQDAARQADEACEAAASALRSYAGTLEAAVDEVRGMQDRAEHLLEVELEAERAAEEAAGALRAGQSLYKMGAMDAAADGGSLIQQAQMQIDQATGDLTAARDRASAAREEIERLKGEAATTRADVDREGVSAAGRLAAARSLLPETPGAPDGSAGGTTLSSRVEKDAIGVTVLVVHVGGTSALIKERSANGEWKVTRVDGVEGGLEFDPVPGAGVDSERAGRLGGGPDATAAFLAGFKKAETFKFRSEREADRFIEYRDRFAPTETRVPSGRGGYYEVPQPTPEERAAIEWADRQTPESTFSEGGTRATIDVQAGPVAGGSGETESVIGAKHAADGTETTYARVGDSLEGHIDQGPLSGGGTIKGETLTALTTTDDGRPASYSVTVSEAGQGQVGGSASGEHPRAKGGVAVEEGHGVRVERQTTLDLNDPENREAVQDYLDSGAQDPRAAERLATRLEEAGRTDVRVYDTGVTSGGANVDTKVVKVDVSTAVETTEVTDVEHRGPGSRKKVETVP